MTNSKLLDKTPGYTKEETSSTGPIAVSTIELTKTKFTTAYLTLYAIFYSIFSLLLCFYYI